MIAPIAAPAAPSVGPIITQIGLPAQPPATPTSSFSEILAGGVQHVESKLANADDLVRRFALDDSVPLHRVTYALEEARMSVELAMQIRGKLVDGYRDIMNMQI